MASVVELVPEGAGLSRLVLIEEGVAWVVRHGHRVGRLGPGDVVDAAAAGTGTSIVAATPMRLVVLPPAARDPPPSFRRWMRAG